MNPLANIAVVIPCYRAKSHIADVLAAIPDCVASIHVVDDACPEKTGRFVQEHVVDSRIQVHFNATNLGVGGAVLRGYAEAISAGADVIVKIDGDGQMDPSLLERFVMPIVNGEADYTKGNRFFDLSNIKRMPASRIFGNAALSFLSKLSTGYWDIFDPTNGYTAIHAGVAEKLPADKISQRFFFESDLLFRLNIQRAVVIDIPMDAKYGEEVSNLRITDVAGEFLLKHIRNFVKRIFYNFFLRDVSAASIELVLGCIALVLGALFGIYSWVESARTGTEATAGTVMLAALPLIVGLQLVLGFLNYDIASVPRRPVHLSGRSQSPRRARGS